jgi:hypothetical protein
MFEWPEPTTFGQFLTPSPVRISPSLSRQVIGFYAHHVRQSPLGLIWTPCVQEFVKSGLTVGSHLAITD